MIIVGGGLAGLTAALHFSKHGIKVLLIEKNAYPKHKVCGEYISNEVIPYLNSLGVDPFAEGAIPITQFEISTKKGGVARAKLPLGGFGISRYALDLLLYEKVKDRIDVVFGQVDEIRFEEDSTFTVDTKSNETYRSHFLIGAYGKRSNLDVYLQRDFIEKRSPWLAVKAHYEFDFKDDVVALHNFDGGYCGLSKTETGVVNACYLAKYTTFKKSSGIAEFQETVMSQNPHLKTFFEQATPVFERPLSIAQVSFYPKNPVEHNTFMIGDSAGLIHPLCGNGMAMAIHSAKLISEILVRAIQSSSLNREAIEKKYSEQWRQTFQTRLFYGRILQQLLLNKQISHWGVQFVKRFPVLIPKLICKTHGSTF
ncbi:NAD(P)/FAD-dependent oxidoreductase [Aureisphaera galaxeae]|uniref:NAD(P)/FAD-dependent oxidoreductase n=1 Tax=Aureisphaera galaxeae TaxID=1538023 RepID=UPI0023505271|nr:NAD(P)/FAD-dependent oxidoreductase [Aureisphaera galaxeae]MDC8004220.1 NAD(P)/FAD-dependent oxidoreductase [Aureisphaera galaxeae]